MSDKLQFVAGFRHSFTAESRDNRTGVLSEILASGSESTYVKLRPMIEIRRAKDSDFDGIWQIFHQVVGRGDTYATSPETTKEQARSMWMSEGVTTYVALLGTEIVGSYVLRANHPGRLGSHVANASYMVSPTHTRKGIGRMMCEHSLEEARKAGFLAMQFNRVVSANHAAIELYKKIGFVIVGTVPKAFQHRTLGLVDVFIMHRFL